MTVALKAVQGQRMMSAEWVRSLGQDIPLLVQHYVVTEHNTIPKF